MCSTEKQHTFGGDQQGGHLEHGLCELFRVLVGQGEAHLMDHQLAQVSLAVRRLRELNHTSHLQINAYTHMQLKMKQSYHFYLFI